MYIAESFSYLDKWLWYRVFFRIVFFISSAKWILILANFGDFIYIHSYHSELTKQGHALLVINLIILEEVNFEVSEDQKATCLYFAIRQAFCHKYFNYKKNSFTKYIRLMMLIVSDLSLKTLLCFLFTTFQEEQNKKSYKSRNEQTGSS